MQDEKYLKIALEEARQALSEGEIPIGAVLTDENGNILSKAHNLREKNHMATAHAELLAIEESCRQKQNWRLENCTLYVTLEPCPMCASAAIHARIGRIVFGAKNPREGAFGSLLDLSREPLECHPKIECGLMAEDCLKTLQQFFQNNRKQK